jgi:hypothetical protein
MTQIPPRTHVGRRVRFLILCVCIGTVIVATTLGISSLIHDGRGMLGISSTFSLGFLISLGATAFVALLGVIWQVADTSLEPSSRLAGAVGGDQERTWSSRSGSRSLKRPIASFTSPGTRWASGATRVGRMLSSPSCDAYSLLEER